MRLLGWLAWLGGLASCAEFVGSSPTPTIDATPAVDDDDRDEEPADALEEPTRPEASVEEPDAPASVDAADDADVEVPDAAPPEPDPCLPSDAAAGLLADSLAGYRLVQGECGWRYLWQTAEAAPVPMQTAAMEWRRSGHPLPLLRRGGAHPENDSNAVLRWTSTYTGVIRIRGEVRDLDPGGGNGISWSLRVGSQVVESRVIANGTSHSIDVSQAVSSGQNLEFSIGANGENSYDTTALSVQISR